MRPEKGKIVEDLKSRLENAGMMILADHTGLSSNQMNELRNQMRNSGADYMVVKNRLLKRALREEVVDLLGPALAGPTGLAVGSGDSAVISRVITNFAKKNEAPKIKAGFMDGALLSAAQVGTLASLPPRDALLGMLLGTMQGPVTALARSLGELLRQFAYVVDQVAKKSK